MKHPVLHRYEHTDDHRVVIDVGAERIEDLYNDFDKNAPFVRRDLAQDLVDYLIDCVREVHGQKFILRFTLARLPDETRQSRVRRSVNAYFLYLAQMQRRRALQLIRRSTILSSIGITLLFLSVYVHGMLGEDQSVVENVFAEGLTVASWVSLWEALAVFLVQWFPLRHDRILYRQLAEAKVTFRAETELATAPDPAR